MVQGLLGGHTRDLDKEKLAQAKAQLGSKRIKD
jgi:hypothetical protein